MAHQSHRREKVASVLCRDAAADSIVHLIVNSVSVPEPYREVNEVCTVRCAAESQGHSQCCSYCAEGKEGKEGCAKVPPGRQDFLLENFTLVNDTEHCVLHK